jgi:hypothetical protein
VYAITELLVEVRLSHHRGEHLQVRLGLSAQSILNPLAILVKHSSNDPAAAFELAAPNLFQLLLEAQF